MSIESALAAGRMAAEARMTSRANVRRKTGATVVNGDGLEVPEWATIATPPFRLDGASDGSSRGVTVGGVLFETATGVAHLPYATVLADSDYLEVTAGEWTGSVYRVVKATAADQKTARRVPVESVARPSEWGL